MASNMIVAGDLKGLPICIEPKTKRVYIDCRSIPSSKYEEITIDDRGVVRYTVLTDDLSKSIVSYTTDDDFKEDIRKYIKTKRPTSNVDTNYIIIDWKKGYQFLLEIDDNIYKELVPTSSRGYVATKKEALGCAVALFSIFIAFIVGIMILSPDTDKYKKCVDCGEVFYQEENPDDYSSLVMTEMCEDCAYWAKVVDMTVEKIDD